MKLLESLEDDDHHPGAQQHEGDKDIEFTSQEERWHNWDPKDARVGIILSTTHRYRWVREGERER
jgi:hypothetical protein